MTARDPLPEPAPSSDASLDFRSILDEMSDGVSVADARGRFVFINRAGLRIVGRGVSSEEHSAWSRHYGVYRADGVTPFPPDELPLVRALRGESGENTEMFIRNADVPEGRYLSVNHRPWRDADGRILGGIVVYRDVSELRRAKAAARQITDMIVHDLQNPLAGIQGFLQLLEMPSESRAADEREALQEALRRCRDLGEMISNVLAVGRADEGKLAADLGPVDLADLARRTAASFAAAARVEGRTLRAEADGAVFALADAHLAQRILENLVRNALRHTPRGTGVVLKAAVPALGGGELSVVDDGPGIPPEAHAALFERFSGPALRARGVRVDNGLGLPFCKAAADVMGARLSVESDGRRGTTFRVRFSAVPS